MNMPHTELYVKWKGDPCPVGPLETVSVIQRSGLRVTAFAEGQRWSWGPLISDRDVVAWTRDNVEAIANDQPVQLYLWVY